MKAQEITINVNPDSWSQQWRTATCLPYDFRPPEDVSLSAVLDPSFTANDQSDESALACGFNQEGEEALELVLLDAVSEKWKGMGLVRTTLDFLQTWKPAYFTIEASGPCPLDLFCDVLREKAVEKGVTVPPPRIVSPRGVRGSKAKRVARLQTDLLDHGFLKIRRFPQIEKLYKQVDGFDFTKSDNQCREDGLVDAISRLAGFQ